jgi:hypothetical protein
MRIVQVAGFMAAIMVALAASARLTECRRGDLSLVRQLRRQMGRIELRVYFPQAVPGDPRGQRRHLRPEPLLSALSTTADVFTTYPAVTPSSRFAQADA